MVYLPADGHTPNDANHYVTPPNNWAKA